MASLVQSGQPPDWWPDRTPVLQPSSKKYNTGHLASITVSAAKKFGVLYVCNLIRLDLAKNEVPLLDAELICRSIEHHCGPVILVRWLCVCGVVCE